jgi:hypothetical protein
MSSVKLDAPMSGPAADQHRQQLALDALDLMAEKNLAELEAMELGYVLLCSETHDRRQWGPLYVRWGLTVAEIITDMVQQAASKYRAWKTHLGTLASIGPGRHIWAIPSDFA